MENLNCGLYIVTLKNILPISVNSQDKRRAEKAIKVNKDFCKIGKAKNFLVRKKNYIKTFGVDNVNYRPFVKVLEIDIAEKLILKKLEFFRVKGPTGLKNEWLLNLSIEDLEKIILFTLDEANIPYFKIVIND